MVALEVERDTTQSSNVFARAVTWGTTKLSDIRNGAQISWGSVLTALFLAVAYFGGNMLMTSHDQSLTQPIQTQGQLSVIQTTVSNISTQVGTITAELPSLIERQNELEARVDCLQAVASTEFCQKRRTK